MLHNLAALRYCPGTDWRPAYARGSARCGDAVANHSLGFYSIFAGNIPTRMPGARGETACFELLLWIVTFREDKLHQMFSELSRRYCGCIRLL